MQRWGSSETVIGGWLWPIQLRCDARQRPGFAVCPCRAHAGPNTEGHARKHARGNKHMGPCRPEQERHGGLPEGVDEKSDTIHVFDTKEADLD